MYSSQPADCYVESPFANVGQGTLKSESWHDKVNSYMGKATYTACKLDLVYRVFVAYATMCT
jgi:hypothetical protein